MIQLLYWGYPTQSHNCAGVTNVVISKCILQWCDKSTYLNSQPSQSTEKDCGLGHLVHGTVSQHIALATRQKEKGSRTVICFLYDSIYPKHCSCQFCNIALRSFESPSTVNNLRFLMTPLACRESRLFPSSLQPCWEGKRVGNQLLER